MDDTDKTLISLLQANARASTAELARKLQLSRSTVKDRILRLERQGIIKGYGVKLSETFGEGQITAHVMIDVDPKQSGQIVRQLGKINAIKALYAVNGIHDLLAITTTDSTQALDRALDQIGDIEGIEKTVSSIVLSTKFER
jgi:DNA-binding Lrp family transcriptional regulator